MSEPEDSEEPTGAAQPAQRRRRLMHIPTPAPVRLLGRARRAAENLPFAGEAFKRLRETEDWALAELKHRLDDIGGTAARWAIGDGVDDFDLKRHLAQLLLAARENSSEEARQLMYRRALEQMLPEQARILAVLGQAEMPALLLHVDAGPPVGPTGRRILANASSVGKDAGIVWRDDIPRLVTQMMALGVVAEGPEAKHMKPQYEVLETEDCVRAAVELIKNETGLWPRMQRRTLVLTRFGADLWRAARPEELGER